MLKKCLPALAVLATALAAVGPLRAADDHSHHDHAQHQAAAQSTEKPTSVQVKYDDTQLTDQNGKQVKFKSEVLGNRLVVIDFAYTSCTTVCPVLTALMVKVQTQLGGRVGNEVQLVTVTVDPARDTPARMKEYAAKNGVKPGWVWLTGPVGQVNDVLKGFGAYSANFEEHPPLVLVGDPASNNWTRFYGFSDPNDIVAKVDELSAARQHASHQHKH